MGEIAEEILQISREVMEDNLARSGGKVAWEGVPEYDVHFWRGIDDVVRELRYMDTMHLALVYKQLENGKGRFYKERKYQFEQELRKRDFNATYWENNLLGIALGLYCFYSDEDSTYLEDYYSSMLKPYLKGDCVDFSKPSFL